MAPCRRLTATAPTSSSTCWPLAATARPAGFSQSRRSQRTEPATFSAALAQFSLRGDKRSFGDLDTAFAIRFGFEHKVGRRVAEDPAEGISPIWNRRIGYRPAIPFSEKKQGSVTCLQYSLDCLHFRVHGLAGLTHGHATGASPHKSESASLEAPISVPASPSQKSRAPLPIRPANCAPTFGSTSSSCSAAALKASSTCNQRIRRRPSRYSTSYGTRRAWSSTRSRCS